MTEQTRLGFEQFTLKAIVALRRNDKGELGMHSVWSGYNQAAREYFPGLDVIVAQETLVAEGKIQSMKFKGGALLFLPTDPMPVYKDKKVGVALAKILG